MRRPRPAVRRGTLTSLPAVAVLVAGLTAGCTGSTDDAEPGPETATPLAEVDLTGVQATRTAFCDALSEESVAAVIGGEPDRTDEYSSGQKVVMAPGLEDVAHEFSCHFERGSGGELRTARAWLFARPATAADARGWIKERNGEQGCQAAGELEFGAPGLVQSCERGPRLRVTAVGLFGDGWLTCQSTAPKASDAADLLEETQQWCAEVAQATSEG